LAAEVSLNSQEESNTNSKESHSRRSTNLKDQIEALNLPP